eukprot:CAMPEP_0172831278 /NCGR_PEP_ID=MMETSP1075-20121228/22869_1 /TAXON_ID=2916 /ORGANISM="Ceratium fusus, Strain PA161109" /LENGTH=116 /DNA_ID=CAMNT_0013673731 /DNA_START=128 /DNA_END=479 /DNA_ORIENTATION=+
MSVGPSTVPRHCNAAVAAAAATAAAGIDAAMASVAVALSSVGQSPMRLPEVPVLLAVKEVQAPLPAAAVLIEKNAEGHIGTNIELAYLQPVEKHIAAKDIMDLRALNKPVALLRLV